MSNQARIVSDNLNRAESYYENQNHYLTQYGHSYSTRSSKREPEDNFGYGYQNNNNNNSPNSQNRQNSVTLSVHSTESKLKNYRPPKKGIVPEREPLPPATPQTGPCRTVVDSKIKELIPMVKSMKNEEESQRLALEQKTTDNMDVNGQNGHNGPNGQNGTIGNNGNTEMSPIEPRKILVTRASHPVTLHSNSKVPRMSNRRQSLVSGGEVSVAFADIHSTGNLTRNASFSDDETEDLSAMSNVRENIRDFEDLASEENLMNIGGNLNNGESYDNEFNAETGENSSETGNVEESNPTTPNGTQMNRGWRRDAMKMLEAKICTKEEQGKQNEKRKANREAAKRCRQRKQKKTEQLEDQVKELQKTLLDVNTNWQNEETANKKLKLDLKRLKYIVRTHLREECGQGIFDANNFDNNECWEFLTAGKKKTSTREPTQENGPETGSSSVTENSSRNGVTPTRESHRDRMMREQASVAPASVTPIYPSENQNGNAGGYVVPMPGQQIDSRPVYVNEYNMNLNQHLYDEGTNIREYQQFQN